MDCQYPDKVSTVKPEGSEEGTAGKGGSFCIVYDWAKLELRFVIPWYQQKSKPYILQIGKAENLSETIWF